MSLAACSRPSRPDIGYTRFQGAVGPDGSRSATGMIQLQHQAPRQAAFAGTASGASINASYKTQFCGYSFALQRQ